jgi:DNA-binding CsgD family transcriptional regulator
VGIALGTVKTHVRRAAAKMMVRGKRELVKAMKEKVK